MNCNSCGTTVEDDLIFCTNCGQRLIGVPASNTTDPTVVAPRTKAMNETPAPSGRGFVVKIAVGVVLCVILVAVGAVAIIGFLAAKSRPNAAPTANAKPSPTAAKKTPSNQNANAAPSASATPSPSPTPAPSDGAAETIVAERLEIDVDSNYAVPFEATDKLTFVGRVKSQADAKLKAFVYTQEGYDENFPDENYKNFTVITNNFENKQTLVPGKYVLVFINDGDKPATIETDFRLLK